MVMATGGGGTDTADLQDSDGNDFLTVNQTDASFALTPLLADPVDIEIFGFGRINAYAVNGGFDTADLSGTDGDDTFLGRRDYGVLSDTAGLDYYNYVRYFDEIFAESGGEEDDDTLNILEEGPNAIIYDLIPTGSWN
jgi:hypothetical protein